MLSPSDYDHLPSQEELDQTHIQLVSYLYNGIGPRFIISAITCLPPQTYHNGCIDYPTDDDLETVSYEVARTTGNDWTKLQTALEIPQYVMMDILNQGTVDQQIFRYVGKYQLHMWVSNASSLIAGYSKSGGSTPETAPKRNWQDA